MCVLESEESKGDSDGLMANIPLLLLLYVCVLSVTLQIRYACHVGSFTASCVRPAGSSLLHVL